MYWNKKDQAYRNKIFASAIAHKSPYYHRNLCVNRKDTGVKIVRIKTSQQLIDQVAGLSELDNKVCYQFAHVKLFSTFLFNSAIDLVFTNRNGVVITASKNIRKDSAILRPEGTMFAWVMAIGSIDALNINVGVTVDTK